MRRHIPFVLLAGLVSIGLACPAHAQRQPSTYAECDALYAREFKKAASQTGKDLRESQRLAGLQRIRCNRAVEQKIFNDRAKGARKRG
jgi:hypothetical protein